MTKRRRTCLWLVAASLLATASASTEEVSHYDRFQLWNDCRPMDLVVQSLSDDAADIGLVEDAIEIAARSLLRAARLYSEDGGFETGWAKISISVNVVGATFSTGLEYWKVVQDHASGLENRATTWDFDGAGTHGKDLGYILSSVSQIADRFIDEYLRVNADACE